MKPRFNGVYSRNNLSKKKGGVYIINLDEYESIGTHCIALYVNDNNVTYFDSVGVKYIPKEIKKIIGNKNVVTNIYQIQSYDSTMCGYFCIGFIDFMLKSKSLLEYTNLFPPDDDEKNDKIILKYFELKRWKNYITLLYYVITTTFSIKKMKKIILCYSWQV